MPSCIPVMTIAMITFMCRAVFILKKYQQFHSMTQKKKKKIKLRSLSLSYFSKR